MQNNKQLPSSPRDNQKVRLATWTLAACWLYLTGLAGVLVSLKPDAAMQVFAATTATLAAWCIKRILRVLFPTDKGSDEE